MGKKKLDAMLDELFERLGTVNSAREVIKTAEAKIDADIQHVEGGVSVNVSYEGNGAGYIYAAYVMLKEAVGHGVIEDIDGGIKVIEMIAMIPSDRKKLNEEGEEAETEDIED